MSDSEDDNKTVATELGSTKDFYGTVDNKVGKALSTSAYEGKHPSIFGKIGTLVKKSGYLMKQGANWKGWRRRYFVLQGPFMTYFEDETSPSPNGVIVLEGCTIEACATAKWNKEFAFEIGHPDIKRVFVLQANSDQHRESWMKAIREGIQWPALIPELMLKYDEMETKLTKSKLELKKALEQQDNMEKAMIDLQRQADDSKAVVSLFNFKMEEKDGTIREQQEEIEKLKLELKKYQAGGKPTGAVIGGSSSLADMKQDEVLLLQERIHLLEEEKANTSKKMKELTEKYNKKRVERELLRKEVLRLKKVLGEPTPHESASEINE